MTPPEVPAQHNHGSGIFIGGDNHGSIQAVDAKTKALLAKMTDQAPALGGLLSKALKDGVISPDAVYALERAAWSINLDVASMLMQAGDSINMDVASRLMHVSEDINPRLVSNIESATAGLVAATRELADVSFTDEINRLRLLVSTLGKEAGRVERTVTRPPPVEVVNWRITWWAFVIGMVIGAFGIGWILMHR